MAEQFKTTGRVHIVCPDGIPYNTRITIDGTPVPCIQSARITIEANQPVRADLTVGIVPVDLMIDDCAIDMSAAVRFEVERRYERAIGWLSSTLFTNVVGGWKTESDEVRAALREVYDRLLNEFTHNVPPRGHVGEEMAALRKQLKDVQAENEDLRAELDDIREGRKPADG